MQDTLPNFSFVTSSELAKQHPLSCIDEFPVLCFDSKQDLKLFEEQTSSNHLKQMNYIVVVDLKNIFVGDDSPLTAFFTIVPLSQGKYFFFLLKI